MNTAVVLAFLVLVGLALLVAAIVVVSSGGDPGARDALVAVARIVAGVVRHLGL